MTPIPPTTRSSWLLLAPLALLGACAREAPRPDIVLITIDTLRPDAVGWIGERNDTPTLDRLAREGLAFRHAVTSVPITLPAHAAMLTGCYPFRLGLRDNGQMLAAGTPTLASRLREQGYRTAAFVSGFPLKRSFGLDQGFDHYDDTMPSGREGYVERRARDTSEAALAWLGDQDDDAPVFVWIHYYDPHDPYEPPREFWQPGPRGAYDGEVVYTDYWIGRLLDGWPARPDRERLTIYTADHGEALGEHGEDTHGYFVYDSTVLAPLVWHWPERVAAREDPAQVRHVDIAPTVMALLGVAEPVTDGSCEGSALTAVTQGGDSDSRPAFVETWLPWNYFGWSPLFALREPGWKYIDAPTPELFDLVEDPGELRNLAAGQPDQADRRLVALDAIRSAPPVRDASAADGDVLEQLRGLGYIGIGQGSIEVPAGVADPKDRIEMRRQLIAADGLLAAGQVGPGLAALEQVLAQEPGSRFAALRAGTHLLKLDQPSQALPFLERAVGNDPERSEARYALADALTRLGRHADALEHWLELARLQPRRFEAWFNIAVCHLSLGNLELAQQARDRAAGLAEPQPGAIAGLDRMIERGANGTPPD
jgi:arylsulfatase A-like enzyme